jgi:hypothetical protein
MSNLLGDLEKPYERNSKTKKYSVDDSQCREKSHMKKSRSIEKAKIGFLIKSKTFDNLDFSENHSPSLA